MDDNKMSNVKSQTSSPSSLQQSSGQATSGASGQAPSDISGQAVKSDDTAVPAASQQGQQPVVYVEQPSTPAKPTPPTPVGGMKEGAPVSAPKEWVSPSAPEITPTQEVSTFVEVTPEVPQISQAAQQVGVKHAKEATPVPTVKAEPINISTPHPVLLALKKAHGSIKDSMGWLVSLIIKEQDKTQHEKVHKEKGDFFS